MKCGKRVISLFLALILSICSVPAFAASYVTAKTAVNMRVGPDMASAVVCVLPKNSVAEKTGTFGNWYEVIYQGKSGYVYKTYLSEGESASAKTLYITANSLNVRSAPSTSASIIGSLKKGDSVQATALSNGWYTIVFSGMTGYISADYVSETAPATGKTIYMTVDVTVYAAPKTSATKLGTLEKGASATATALVDGWYTIQYNNTAGFISSQYATTTPPSSGSSTPTFTDVPSGKFYTDAVAWAVENGITSGTSETTFSPNNACTRAEIVTFLWRAVGSPTVSIKNPFSDVKTSDYYYLAVLWAVKNGVTSGTSATTFSPNATCSRAEAVTFLWNEAGKPSTTNSIAFNDVSSSAFYYKAVKWAVKYGITSGTSSTKFSPKAVCTRAQVVTLLYRYIV